jgi:hypothetical protein
VGSRFEGGNPLGSEVIEEVLLKTKLIALVVPATLALAAGGMVAAYAATPTPPAPANSQAAEQAETGAAEKAEAPEAPGAPEVGHADDPKDANADHQFEGQE